VWALKEGMLFIAALLLTMRKTPEDTGDAVTCGYRICAILGAKWLLGGADAADAFGIWPLCAFVSTMLHLEPLRRVEV
jgi:hypothetical protein